MTSAGAVSAFAQTVAAGNPVRAICAPGCGSYSRRQLDELEVIAKEAGAKGLAWMAVEDGEAGPVRSPIAKFFSAEQLQAIIARAGATPGDLLLFAADAEAVVCEVLDTLRREIAHRLAWTIPRRWPSAG